LNAIHCLRDTLEYCKTPKDAIKQVVLIGTPLSNSRIRTGYTIVLSIDTPYKIFRKKLIEYQIIELKNNEGMLKILVESNYWKHFCPIEILTIFNKPVIQLLEEDMSVAQHFSNYD